jgi:hypothetical protein
MTKDQFYLSFCVPVIKQVQADNFFSYALGILNKYRFQCSSRSQTLDIYQLLSNSLKYIAKGIFVKQQKFC